MKKLIVIIVFLLIAGFAQAQSWLEVEWAIQAGAILSGGVSFYETSLTVGDEDYHINFIFNILVFNFVKLGGYCNSLFSPTDNINNFCPTGMNYLFYIGIEPIKGISIIYEGSCFHPVSAYSSKGGNEILDAAWRRIYIEIKGKLIY